MTTIIVAGFALGNGLAGPQLFGPNHQTGASGYSASEEAPKSHTGYTTVYKDPNGPGPDGQRFVGRRNYTIVSGVTIDQSKGFEI